MRIFSISGFPFFSLSHLTFHVFFPHHKNVICFRANTHHKIVEAGSFLGPKKILQSFCANLKEMNISMRIFLILENILNLKDVVRGEKGE